MSEGLVGSGTRRTIIVYTRFEPLGLLCNRSEKGWVLECPVVQ